MLPYSLPSLQTVLLMLNGSPRIQSAVSLTGVVPAERDLSPGKIRKGMKPDETFSGHNIVDNIYWVHQTSISWVINCIEISSVPRIEQCIFLVFAFKIFYSFIWKKGWWNRRDRKKEIFNALVHSPDDGKFHGWAQLKPGQGTPFGSPMWVTGAQALELSLVAFPGASARSWIKSGIRKWTDCYTGMSQAVA